VIGLILIALIVVVIILVLRRRAAKPVRRNSSSRLPVSEQLPSSGLHPPGAAPSRGPPPRAPGQPGPTPNLLYGADYGQGGVGYNSFQPPTYPPASYGADDRYAQEDPYGTVEQYVPDDRYPRQEAPHERV